MNIKHGPKIPGQVMHERKILDRSCALVVSGGTLTMAVYSKYSLSKAYLLVTLLVRGRALSIDVWRSHLAERSPLDRSVTVCIRSRGDVQRLLESTGFRDFRYQKRGFVQRYLPVAGRLLDSAGVVLNSLSALLGCYHVLTFERTV